MKKKIDILRYADDKYVEEADPARRVHKKSRLSVMIAAVMTVALLLGVLSALFTPMSTRKDQSSGYLKIQSGIKDYLALYGKKANSDRYEATNGMGFDFVLEAEDGEALENYLYKVETDTPDAPTDAAGSDDVRYGESYSQYKEVTDNQVDGVIEGDRFKRSDTHIFYLDANNILKVYTIEGLDSKEVAKLSVKISGKDIVALDGKNNVAIKEMFLAANAKTLTLIAEYTLSDGGEYTRVINYDVSSPEAMEEKAYIDISGSYLSARYIDGKLVIMNSQKIYENELYDGDTINFGNDSDYLPQISDVNGELKTLAEEDIIIPDNTSRLCYTTVTVRNSETLESYGDKSFFSHSTDAYVTKNDIYLTSIYANVTEKSDRTIRDAMTEITCVTIGDGALNVKGTVTVRGYVKDQYSMDCHEGILRVVTTTNSTEYSKDRPVDYGYGESFRIATATGRSSASLYCIDADSFKLLAEVKDFAPPHEEVQSARFDGDTAYVCTSIEMSDPVFFFDLSDINNITYKDTGTIDGYSTSLVNLKDGYLLGFGVANWSDVKIEIYEETEDGVASVCSYIIRSADIADDHKAHFIDRERNLIGFGVEIRSGHGYTSIDYEYILLEFNGEELVEVLRTNVSGNPHYHRATLIDEYFYILHTDGLTVKKLYE